MKDIHTLFILRRVLKELKSDMVLSYMVKPIIYGSIAAHRAGVKQIYAMVTGLGYVFVGQSIKKAFDTASEFSLHG